MLLRALCGIDLSYVWEDIFFKTPIKERYSQLSDEERTRLVFGSVRNPWGWYYSFWKWYCHPRMQEHMGKDHRIISAAIPFEAWVIENPRKMVEEFQIHYSPSLRLIRVEYFAEEIIPVLEEAGESLSDQGRDLIRNWVPANVDEERAQPYETFYTEEMRGLILQGAGPIFDAYYPDRQFPKGDGDEG